LAEGDLDAAERCFAAGIEAGERSGHVEWLAENRWQSAVIDYFRDELDAFEAAAEELLGLCQSADLLHLEGRVRESLASVLTRRGDRAGARAHLAEAQAISEAMEDRLGAINVLGTLAELAMQAGELQEAASLATDAMVRSLDIGAEEAVIVMRWGLATIELAQNDLASAEGRLHTCLGSARAGGYRYWEACALTSLGQAARMREDFEEAEARLAEAQRCWDEIGHAWGQAFVWLEEGALARESGELQRAEEGLNRAQQLANEASDAHRGLQVRLELGRLAFAAGDMDAARSQLEALHVEASELGAGMVAQACGLDLAAIRASS
jgi:tetratricopeptide (TPR) repeat protein